MIIRFDHLSFGYGEGARAKIFDGFSLAVEPPAHFLGPSGCGKTTLLKLAAGLLVPGAGRVVIEDEGLPGTHSFVFQEPRLLPWLTVEENVALPLLGLGGKRDRAGARERALYFLDQVSLADKARAFPGDLSGGQQQRAAIARAFAYPGRLLLMDEPFHSLDIPLRLELMDLTRALLEREDRRLLAVTHDPREALAFGGGIFVLGLPPRGVVFAEDAGPPGETGGYLSPRTLEGEKRLLTALSRAGAEGER